MVNARPQPLYPPPQERPSTHCIGGWVGPRASLDGCGQSRPAEIQTWTARPVASHYTVWAIPAHLNISYNMNYNLDAEVHHTHQTTRHTYINLFNNGLHNQAELLHLASFILTTLPQDTTLKSLLQTWTTLNFQLHANDHPYTYNHTTGNSKLTCAATNHTEFHDTAKMEKPKHNSIGGILSRNKYVITDGCHTIW